MTSVPTTDHGQRLDLPSGKLIGFIDTKAGLEAFAKSMRASGYASSKLTSLYGDDGVRLLERLKEGTFFFADSEDSILPLGIKQLREGHYVVAVDVKDHDQAAQIAKLATPQGGHGFNYFGALVSEQLS
jgi:hypothetical protein